MVRWKSWKARDWAFDLVEGLDGVGTGVSGDGRGKGRGVLQASNNGLIGNSTRGVRLRVEEDLGVVDSVCVGAGEVGVSEEFKIGFCDEG